MRRAGLYNSATAHRTQHRTSPVLHLFDIILEVNRQAVNNASQVTKALQSAPDGTPVFLLVWRGGQEQFVTMSKR